LGHMDRGLISRNSLFAELPEPELAAIGPLLERIHYTHGDWIARPDQPFSHGYFPLSGMASIVALTSEGLGAEVATVGNEGMVGLPIFLGAVSSPFALMWQLDGEALQISASDLIRVASPGSHLAAVLTKYTQAVFVQTAQSSACNALHPVSQRGARWLLATHDRADRDEFFLTHEFLAFMLGVTRQSVSIAVGDLQQAGLIRYHRGHMEILDRPGLEAASCECYRIVRAEFERLLRIGRA
jgi:CRP-like cAMP-binding protein